MLRTRAFDFFNYMGLTSERDVARAIERATGDSVSHTTIWRIRTGKQQPSRVFIVGAIRVTEQPYDVLFYLDERPSGCPSGPAAERAIACALNSRRMSMRFVTEYLPVEKVPQSTDDGTTS